MNLAMGHLRGWQTFDREIIWHWIQNKRNGGFLILQKEIKGTRIENPEGFGEILMDFPILKMVSDRVDAADAQLINVCWIDIFKLNEIIL